MLRWKAIKDRLVEEFLKGLHKENLDLIELNMFLAEDRIMSFEIVREQ